MNYRFKNARLLINKKDSHSFDIKKGELWTSGNIISFLGNKEEAEEEIKNKNINFDEEIDCEGNLLMPGFKNAHTHTAMTFLRSHADDLPLNDWLFKKVFPKEDKLKEEDIYWLNLLGILEYLTSGITANFDMYFYPPMIAKSSFDAGFRTVLTSGFNNFGAGIEKVESDYNAVNAMGSDLVSFIIGFHAEYTTSMERMKDLASLAKKVKSPVFLHNSETKKEVDECVERWGMTPTKLMEELGMYEYGGGGYHCVYLSDEDIDIMKKRHLYAVTNPSSNLKLASGIAPVKKLLDEGINLAIGTDGPASNNALDFFREMYLAAVLPKVRENDAAAVSAEEILYSATNVGAKCMGLNDCVSIEKGKKADIIMIDLYRPNMQPFNNIIKNLVYAGSKENVKMTMINGRMLYCDKKFYLKYSPDEIYDRVNDIVNRIKSE